MGEFASFVFEELFDVRGGKFVVEKLRGMFERAPDSAAAVAVLKNPTLVVAVLRESVSSAGAVTRGLALSAAASLDGVAEALVAADGVELDEFLSLHREVFGTSVPDVEKMSLGSLAELLGLCEMRLEEREEDDADDEILELDV